MPLLFCFLCFVANTTAQETDRSEYPSNSAEAWLNKMSGAMKTLNYEVSFVLLKPGVDSQPYMWRHGVNDSGVEMEQLNLLNGPGREVVRIGDKVSYFEPNVPPYSLRAPSINGPFPGDFFQHPEKLKDSYDFVLVGRSRISGRAAQQIRVVSKDKSRFGLSIWLDQDTGLMLKMNMIDLEGKLLEQIQVTGIKVTEDPDLFFARIEKAMLPEVLSMKPTVQLVPKWQVVDLPLGMRQVKLDVHRLSLTGETVEYVMLTDGLVDVSIYLQEVGLNAAIQDGTLRHESDTLLTRRQGNLSVTVVGKLPVKTANIIANSIRSVN